MSAELPLLRLVDVRKAYSIGPSRWPRPRAQLVAVKAANLSINAGETVALVGESGSGKSTIGRMILRLETPDAGRIEFIGQEIHHASAHDLKLFRSAVQAVFQDPWSSLDPRHRLWSLVSEPLRIQGGKSRDEITEIVSEALQSVGVDHRDLRKFPHEFSGGQLQRIAIARALTVGPRLMVLDEPISSLDVSIRAQIMNILADLKHNQGMSFVFISHDLATVRFLADHLLILKEGEVVESGACEAVLGAPQHPYTQALLKAARLR
jgi:ABC-type microcin C transport system duplicated ATPase subunit YejF